MKSKLILGQAMLLALAWWATVSVASPGRPPLVVCRIALDDPSSRALHVVYDVKPSGRRPLKLKFPSWSPGVYTYRPISQFIKNLKASDRLNRSVQIEQLGPDEYRIAHAEGLRVEYDIDLSTKNRSIDKSFIADDLALIKGAFTFCSFEGYEAIPVRVEVRPPKGWKLITNLSPQSGGFIAANYYDLIDSAIMTGNYVTDEVRAKGVRLVVAMDSKLKAPLARLTEMAARIAARQVGIFKSAPFRTYTFFIHIIPEAYFNIYPGGLIGVEHLDNCTISITPQTAAELEGADLLRAFEAIMAHELFHSWNGKAIAPAELSRPDLTSPVNSPNIWFVEGVTRYYDILSRHRSAHEIYDDIGRIVKRGNSGESLQAASLRASEGLSDILYDKGALAALALDIRIRCHTDNARSLDDVLRQLYLNSAHRNRSYTAADLPRIVARVAGKNLDDFFSRFVAGKEKLDIEESLRCAGLKAVVNTRMIPQDIGIFFNRANSQVAALLPGGAGQAAGLQPRDKILAINGQSLAARPFDQAFPDESIGASYSILVRRGDQETTIQMTINPVEETEVRIVEIEAPSEKQIRIRKSIFDQTASLNKPSPALPSSFSIFNISSVRALHDHVRADFSVPTYIAPINIPEIRHLDCLH